MPVSHTDASPFLSLHVSLPRSLSLSEEFRAQFRNFSYYAFFFYSQRPRRRKHYFVATRARYSLRRPLNLRCPSNRETVVLPPSLVPTLIPSAGDAIARRALFTRRVFFNRKQQLPRRICAFSALFPCPSADIFGRPVTGPRPRVAVRTRRHRSPAGARPESIFLLIRVQSDGVSLTVDIWSRYCAVSIYLDRRDKCAYRAFISFPPEISQNLGGAPCFGEARRIQPIKIFSSRK